MRTTSALRLFPLLIATRLRRETVGVHPQHKESECQSYRLWSAKHFLRKRKNDQSPQVSRRQSLKGAPSIGSLGFCRRGYVDAFSHGLKRENVHN
jgi:hypothetical protein